MLTTQTVHRTPYGQLTRKKDGSTVFTQKQAQLVPSADKDVFLLQTGGDTWAIGDGKRYRPPHITPKRGSGAFPQDFLTQPFMSLSVVQKGVPYKGGTAPAFAGTFQHPNERTIGLEPPLEPLPEGETQPGSVGREQYYPAPTEVQAAWQSRLYRPEAPPLTFDDLNLLAQHVPQERPYACGMDRYGLYIASWDHWDNWEGFDVADREPAPTSISFSLTAGEMLYRYANGDTFVYSPQRTLGGAGIRVVTGENDEALYAYRYRFGVAEFIETDELDENGFRKRLSRPVKRTTYSLQPEDSAETIVQLEQEFAPDRSSGFFSVRRTSVGISGGFASAPLDNYRSGYALMASAFGSVQVIAGYYDPNVPPIEYPPDATPPVEYVPDLGIVYTSSQFLPGQSTPYLTGGNVTVEFPTLRESSGSDPGGQDPPPDNSNISYGGSYPYTVNRYEPGFTPPPDFGASSSPSPSLNGYRVKLTDAQRDAALPYSRGWPDPPTPESRAEVAKLNPFIYGEQDDMWPQDSNGPPPYGRLANPAGPLGVASSWFGLAWATLEYTADAFYADLPDPDTKEPVTHLWGVALTHDEGVYTLLVSKDEVQVGSWPLEDLFPTAPKDEPLILKHLDGTAWPPSEGPPLKPSYHFASSMWPLRDVAYLAPFRARLKTKFDKKLPPLCPVMLTFDSFANDYDPVAPDVFRQFYPRAFDKAKVTSISGTTPAQLTALTAPFEPKKTPKAVVTLQGFTVAVDLSDVQLPLKYLVRLYLYVIASKETAPDSYHPLQVAPKSRIWRLTVDVTDAEVRDDDTLTVNLDKPYWVARVVAEVRGLRDGTEPLWFGGVIG